MTSFRYLGLAMALLLTCAAFAQKKPASAEQDTDVLRINTTLVTVPVTVSDRQGRFISGLNESQFHLYENGREQKIAFFDNVEKPFTVALLLDTSDSTRLKLTEIQSAALAFLDQLRDEDRVLVASFDRQVTLLSEATNDRQRLRDAISRVQTGGGTALYNAFDAIVNQRMKEIAGRKAIVIFTDGVDTVSAGATYESTLRLAEELDAMVFPIQYNTYADLTKNPNSETGAVQVLTAKGERMNVAFARANRYLRLMSEKSGGRFFYAESLNRLSDVFSRIARELREQYSIGYYPQADDGRVERALRVRVDAPNCVVRARKAFRYKSAIDEKQRYAVVSAVINYRGRHQQR